VFSYEHSIRLDFYNGLIKPVVHLARSHAGSSILDVSRSPPSRLHRSRWVIISWLIVSAHEWLDCLVHSPVDVLNLIQVEYI
jgi:hypothetical protein